MSNDLIRRSDAIKVAKEFWYKPDIAGALAELPAIEPKRGEWIDVWQDGICSWRGTCSVCRSTNDIPPPFEANFCPSCGARMKGADDE